MTRRPPWGPRSRREVFALLCLTLLAWLVVVLAVGGLSPWSDAALAGLAVAGAAAILAAGVLWARRFRR